MKRLLILSALSVWALVACEDTSDPCGGQANKVEAECCDDEEGCYLEDKWEIEDMCEDLAYACDGESNVVCSGADMYDGCHITCHCR